MLLITSLKKVGIRLALKLITAALFCHLSWKERKDAVINQFYTKQNTNLTIFFSGKYGMFSKKHPSTDKSPYTFFKQVVEKWQNIDSKWLPKVSLLICIHNSGSKFWG